MLTVLVAIDKHHPFPTLQHKKLHFQIDLSEAKYERKGHIGSTNQGVTVSYLYSFLLLWCSIVVSTLFTIAVNPTILFKKLQY